MQPTAFTVKSNAGISNQLVTLVDVVVPNTKNAFQVKAIWDTGATATVITENVVKALGLIPTGMSNVNTANGQRFTINNFELFFRQGLKNL